MSIKIRINGKPYDAEKGEYIMNVARRNKIVIPSFCHHDALPGLGCCRLCVVEVKEGKKRGVVVSCVYPVSAHCEVFTETEKIQGIRRTILSMLRGRAPEGSRIASLCRMYGVPQESRYTYAPPAGRLNAACILCGLCVEACSKLGTGAISAVGRGTGKKISSPFDEPSADCVGCGSCAAVCPTGAIECSEAKGVRAIWGKAFELAVCKHCGTPFATKEELALAAQRYSEKDADSSAVELCETCRRKKSSEVLAKTFGI